MPTKATAPETEAPTTGVVMFALETFDLPRIEGMERPRQALAEQPVTLTEAEANHFKGLRLVTTLKAAPKSPFIDRVNDAEGAVARYLVNRGQGWIDVARPDGTLAAEKLRGRQAALDQKL